MNRNRIHLLICLVVVISFFTSCTKEASVSNNITTFYSVDSLFSFKASSHFEKKLDEPRRILLEFDNSENPDFANILIVSKTVPVDRVKRLAAIDEEVAHRNSKGKNKLLLVGGCDSVRHYKFIDGPQDIDDWYMVKKKDLYEYILYYSGQNICKAEALRLYKSIDELIFEPAHYISAGDSYRIYKDIQLSLSAGFDFVKDNEIHFDPISQRVQDLHKKLIYRMESKPSTLFPSHIAISVHELVVDGDDFLDALEEEYASSKREIRFLKRTNFKGCSALESSAREVEEVESEEVTYANSVSFIYNERLYNIDVVGAEAVVDDCFTYLMNTLELL